MPRLALWRFTRRDFSFKSAPKKMATSDPAQHVYPWYLDELSAVPEPMQKLLQEYSKIPPEDTVRHILEVRNKAFEIFPYPCLGQFNFLKLSLSGLPIYPEIVSRLKEGQQLTDVGCCLGQDIRQLVVDGVPSENLVGIDLVQGLMDAGYDLFQDKGTTQARFIAADMISPGKSLDKVKKQADIVYTASFLHLFKWNEQIKAVKNLISLLNMKPGSFVAGRQIGSKVEGEKAVPKQGVIEETTVYIHNSESFQRLWQEVGAQTGTKWEVSSELVSANLNKILGDTDMGIMNWTARLI